MKHNLIFTIDEKLLPLGKETKSETYVGIIRQFMVQELGDPEVNDWLITVCHYLGVYGEGQSRSIIAVLTNSEQRDIVLRLANRLRGINTSKKPCLTNGRLVV